MKNIDFYYDLLNHSLCYKYNVQLEIARELCKMIKENTLLKSISITSSCPKYITDIFNNNGIKPILNNDDEKALYYEFNEIIKKIKSDKKFNYEIIVKNFYCGNNSDISNYIREINKKLVQSNNTNIETILGLLIDVPNYYLDAVNLMNKYEYKFETQKSTLSYRRLFIEVYKRLRNPNTFNYAIKELASLIVLYYDVTHTPIDQYPPAFLNPIVEPIKSSMLKNILGQHQINLAKTIDTFTSLDYIDVKESEENIVENDINPTSFAIDHYARTFVGNGDINISDFGFTPMDIIQDIFYLVNNSHHGKQFEFNISSEQIMALKKEHELKMLSVHFLNYPKTDTCTSLISKSYMTYMIAYENKLYLLSRTCVEDEFDLYGIEIKTPENKTVLRDLLGIDFDSDVRYEFLV